MDENNLQKEKPGPQAEAGEPLLKTPEEDQRKVRDESAEAKSGKKKNRPGQLLGKEKTGKSKTKDRTKREVLPERKHKRKERAKDGKLDAGDDRALEKRDDANHGDEENLDGAKDTEQEAYSGQVMKESSTGESETSFVDSSDEKESSDADNYISWVQCSNASCGKWRRLSDSVDPSVLPNNWTCQQNTDPAFNSCSAAEETCSVSEEEIFYNLIPGSLVWARQIGYPWWPAMVEKDPDTGRYLEFRKNSDLTPYKCHVTYFEDPVTRAWVPCSRVKDYTELSEDQLSNQVVLEDLKKAVQIAKEAISLSLKDRLIKFGFYSRYLSGRERSEVDSDIAEVLELFDGESGSECGFEDIKRKKQRITERKEKQRKRERAESKTQGNEKFREKREPEEKKKKKKVMKMLKESKEGEKEVNDARVKVQKRLAPSFTHPKRKKKPEHTLNDAGDQTVPQSPVYATPDPTSAPATLTEEGNTDKVRKRKKIRREREQDQSLESQGGSTAEGEEHFGSRNEKELPCGDDEEKKEEELTRFCLMLLEEE